MAAGLHRLHGRLDPHDVRDGLRAAGPAEDQRYHATVTFGWTFYTITLLVNALVGILLVSTFGTLDQLAGQESALPVDIVALTGLLGLLLIWVTQTRINTANLYLASTNLQSFFSRAFRLTLPRTIWVSSRAASATRSC